MSKKFNLNKNTTTVIVLILVAIISIGISFVASKPDIYKPVYEVLDEKRADALALSGAALGLSAVLAAVPDDATTPIANKLSDITSYVLLIVCVIFLEKLFLTSFGFISFAILIPLSCVLGIIYLYKKDDKLKSLAIKLTSLALVVVLLVPTSTLFTTLIENSTFYNEVETSVEETLETKEDVGFWDRLKGKTTELITNAKQKVNEFIDAIAIMIITTCAIPLGTLALLFWIVKMLFGINIKMPKPPKVNINPKKLAKKEDETSKIPENSSANQ